MAQQPIIEKPRVVRNGVDVTSLMETIEAVQENPVIAEFKFRNSNKWVDGALNRSTFGAFYGATEEHGRSQELVFENDEPPVLLGLDRAPNPVEWLLHGIAGCITTTTVYHAAARGIRIDELSTKIEGDLDLRGLLDLPGAKRPGYQKLTLDVQIKGDATDEELKELVEFAKLHSPAVDTVFNGSNIELKVNIS